MAVAVDRTAISSEIAEVIRKYLCLQPLEPVQYQNRFSSSETKPPVLFYIPEATQIHLPYTFAGSLLQRHLNVERVYPSAPITFTSQLFAHQIEVEQESWNQLQIHGTTTVGLYPGFGKTVVGAKLASRAGLITCVLVTRDVLTGQWKKTFEEFTDARGKIWVVGEPNPPPFATVIICMDTRANQLPQDYRDRVGLLIIDEAHMFCTPSRVFPLLAFHPRFVVAETATLEREDGMHSMIQAICGTHGIFRHSTKPFIVTKVLTGIKPQRKMNRQGTVDWAALTRSILFHEGRNRLILSLVENNPERKILILTSIVEHAMLLYEALKSMGIPCDYMVRNKKSYSDSRVLVGTMSKIGTGFDEATACDDYGGKRIDLVILCTSIKKHSLLEQNVGRAFRAESPTVFHLVDDDSIFKSHWCKASHWYRSRNGKFEEMRCQLDSLLTVPPDHS